MVEWLFENMKQERVIGIVTCILWIGHYTHELKTDDTAKEECINELNLDRELADQIDLDQILLENDTGISIFLSCVWIKQGFQDANGDINWRNLEKSFLITVQENLKRRPKLETVISAGIKAKAIKVCYKLNTIGENEGQTIATTQNCILWEGMKNAILMP